MTEEQAIERIANAIADTSDSEGNVLIDLAANAAWNEMKAIAREHPALVRIRYVERAPFVIDGHEMGQA